MKRRDIQDIKAKIQKHEEAILRAKESIDWNEQQKTILVEMVSEWEKLNGDAGPPENIPSICPYCD